MGAASGVAEVGFPDKSVADNVEFVSTLVGIVNAVYGEAEGGIFKPGYQRTTPAEVANLIRARQLAVAQPAGRGGSKPIGCVFIKRLSPTRGEFGMLALDFAHRRAGLGGRMAAFAERHCRDLGCEVMQLELLVPKTFEHAFKERLQAWYLRMGYRLVRLGRFDEDYPALSPLLSGPTEYRVFEKSLI